MIVLFFFFVCGSFCRYGLFFSHVPACLVDSGFASESLIRFDLFCLYSCIVACLRHVMYMISLGL